MTTETFQDRVDRLLVPTGEPAFDALNRARYCIEQEMTKAIHLGRQYPEHVLYHHGIELGLRLGRIAIQDEQHALRRSVPPCWACGNRHDPQDCNVAEEIAGPQVLDSVTS